MIIENKDICITETTKCPCCKQWVDTKVPVEDIEISIRFTIERVANSQYNVIAELVHLLNDEHKMLVAKLKEVGSYDDYYKQTTGYNTIRDAISGVRKLATTLGKSGTYYSLESKDKNFEIHSRTDSTDIYSKTEILVDKYELEDKAITPTERLSNEVNEKTKLFLKIKRQTI